MTSIIWTAEATALRCPHCHASPGARCRTYDGGRASAPHVGRLVPSITCPRCGTVDVEPINVRNGYCSTCHDWTVPSERRGLDPSSSGVAAQDVLGFEL